MAREDEERVIGRLLGEEMQRTFWEFHARDFLSEDNVAYLRTTFCLDGHKQRELYDLYYNWKVEDGIEPGADLRFLRQFWGELEREYSALLQRLDPLSRAAALAARPTKWYKPWPIFSPELWTSWIRPGNDGYVWGKKGTGKTDFLCLIAELFLRRGGTVVSGVPLREEAERYIYCTRGTQLLRTSCELMLKGIPCMVNFDESFIHSSGESPLDTEVKKVRQVARIFRKLGIASCWASQRESDILKDIRIEASFRAQKRSKIRKDEMHVQITAEFARRTPTMEGGKVQVHEFSDFVKWVPPTTLPFRSEAVSTFVMDFDPASLMDYLADLPMEANQYQATLEWMDQRKFYFTLPEKKYLARKMAPFMRQKDIASIIGVTQQQVSNYLSES